MAKSVSFTSVAEVTDDGATRLVFVGRKDRLASDAGRALVPEAALPVWDDLLKDTKPKELGEVGPRRPPPTATETPNFHGVSRSAAGRSGQPSLTDARAGRTRLPSWRGATDVREVAYAPGRHQ